MLIAVISAIAGGKTLLNEILRDNLDVSIVDESLDIMTNINGDNALDNYYTDMKRYSFVTELLFFVTRLEKFFSTRGDIVIMERDWYSGKECFTEMLYEDGFMSQMEYDILSRSFRYLTSASDFPKVDRYIYIRVSIETLMKRLHERKRKEETIGPSMEKYQIRLVEKYEKFISTRKNVLIIDGEQNFRDDQFLRNNVVKTIKEFIGTSSI